MYLKLTRPDISKYFGQSTADGIQFQFRSIKKDADRIRQVADEGGDVASLPLAGVSGGPSVLSTPTKASPTKGTPSKSGGRKRKAPIVKDETAVDDSDPEVASVHDWSDVGDVGTPTKKTTASAKRAKTTPSAASSLAPATTYNDEIVKADPETELAEIASIFGNPTPSAGRSSNTPADNGYGSYPSYAGYGDEI